MVSPLKLWQHPQSENIWPLLGGLSVLAHVGVLGLSLPYVLELMQPASSTTATSSIPIELVDAREVELDSETKIAEPAFEPAAAVVDQSKVSASESTVDVASSGVQAVQTSLDESESSRESNKRTNKTENPNEAEGVEAKRSIEGEPAADSSPTQAASPVSDPSSDAPRSSGNVVSGGEVSGNEVSGNETSGNETSSSAPSSSGPSELPSIPTSGQTPLSEPGGYKASPQSASLRISGFKAVPQDYQRDLGETIPRPVAQTTSSAVELEPVAKGCPRLLFSQQTWVYRVAVEADGSVRSANVWRDGAGGGMSEEERAIACLIEKAGFQFEPALLNGQPKLDDNLLITVDVIEMY